MDPRVRHSEKAAEFRLRELCPNLVLLVTHRVPSHGIRRNSKRCVAAQLEMIQANHKRQVTFHQATVVSSTPEPV